MLLIFNVHHKRHVTLIQAIMACQSENTHNLFLLAMNFGEETFINREFKFTSWLTGAFEFLRIWILIVLSVVWF